MSAAGGGACRFCGAPLRHILRRPRHVAAVRELPRRRQLDQMEPFYPLRVRVCERCFLVQLPEYVSPSEIFTEYAYFSSYSAAWVAARPRLRDARSPSGSASAPRACVVELGSNDGYLLQHFVERGVPVARHRARARTSPRRRRARGVPTMTSRSSATRRRARLVAEGARADLMSATTCWPRSRTSTTSSPGCSRILRARRAWSRSSSRTCCG